MSFPYRDTKHFIGIISVVFVKHRPYYFGKWWQQLFPSHLVIVFEIIPSKLLKVGLKFPAESVSIINSYIAAVLHEDNGAVLCA